MPAETECAPDSESHTMDRRHFLATALVASQSRAAAPSLTFGFSLYGMKVLKTDEALRTLAKIGYDTAELCLLPGYDAEPKNLTREQRHSLAKSPMRITALMENLSLADTDQSKNHDRLKAAFQLSNDLPCSPLIETVMGNGEWDKVKTMFRDRLGEWAKLAQSAKCVLAVKPHRFGAVNRPDQVLWLLDQINNPALKVVYDWSHLIHRDFQLEATIKQLSAVTAFVHVKDTVIVKEKAEFRLPGDTKDIDYPLMLKSLLRVGYSGDVCCEVSGMLHTKPDYDAVRAAERCYNNLAPAFAKAK